MSETQALSNLLVITRRDVNKMECCVYDGPGRLGRRLQPIICHPWIIPLPAITHLSKRRPAGARRHQLQLGETSTLFVSSGSQARCCAPNPSWDGSKWTIHLSFGPRCSLLSSAFCLQPSPAVQVSLPPAWFHRLKPGSRFVSAG